MRLLGAFASPYVARVMLFARIKGIELTVEPWLGDGLKSAESLAFNPIGKMPSLDVDGRCLAESSIICDYLEDAGLGSPGLPEDPFDRSISRLIARITDLYLATHTSPLFRMANPAARDDAVIQASQEGLANTARYLEHFMGPGPFAVGAIPTLGDCALAPYFFVTQAVAYKNFASIPDPTATPGRLQDWYQAVEEHAVLGPGMQEYRTAFMEFVKSMSRG